MAKKPIFPSPRPKIRETSNKKGTGFRPKGKNRLFRRVWVGRPNKRYNNPEAGDVFPQSKITGGKDEPSDS